MDNKLNLLPEDQWIVCEKCHGRVPAFADLSDSLLRELETLSATSPIGAMARLRQAGCTLEISQSWIHHRRFCGDREPCTTPCPHCGKILRTANAKQCRFCGADWH